MILYALEFILVVWLALITVTQVIVPLWRNKPLFPFFRMREKVVSEIGKAAEEVEVSEFEKILRQMQREANQKTNRGK